MKRNTRRRIWTHPGDYPNICCSYPLHHQQPGLWGDSPEDRRRTSRVIRHSDQQKQAFVITYNSCLLVWSLEIHQWVVCYSTEHRVTLCKLPTGCTTLMITGHQIPSWPSAPPSPPSVPWSRFLWWSSSQSTAQGWGGVQTQWRVELWTPSLQ